jgi:hypothetical protein
VREGDVSIAAAAERYGVVISEASSALAVDQEGTAKRRARIKAERDKRNG